MSSEPIENESARESLSNFFNNHHDKLLCTANQQGEPSIALMGTPRIVGDDTIEFEISDPASVTLQNMRANKAVVFMAYVPATRARNYRGVRIYAKVTDILTAGVRLEQVRTRIRERFGEEKAAELLATVSCRIENVRPVVDRGQAWDEPLV